MPSSSGKVSLINVGISPANPSSTASVITTSYVTDRSTQSAKEIIQGLASRKLVINNNVSTVRKDGDRKPSNRSASDEIVIGVNRAANRVSDGTKSIVINTNEALMHSNNNKISMGPGLSAVKYLLPVSPVQISSSGKLEKTV